MYLYRLLVCLPWTNAYKGLTSVPLSSHQIDNGENKHPESFVLAQLLVTLTGPSPATFGTENTTISLPIIGKNQVSNTESTKPTNGNLQDAVDECPEQEDLECDDCGGHRYDRKEGLYRCIGAEKDNFKWKDCFCMRARSIWPYEPGYPTPEESAEEWRNLPDWTNASWAQSPPGWSSAPKDKLMNKGSLEEVKEGSTGEDT